MEGQTAPLPQWTAYAIMIGLILVYILIVWLLRRAKGKTINDFIEGILKICRRGH